MKVQARVRGYAQDGEACRIGRDYLKESVGVHSWRVSDDYNFASVWKPEVGEQSEDPRWAHSLAALAHEVQGAHFGERYRDVQLGRGMAEWTGGGVEHKLFKGGTLLEYTEELVEWYEPRGPLKVLL